MGIMAGLIRWPPLRRRVWKLVYERSARPSAGVVSDLNCLNFGFAPTDGPAGDLPLEPGERLERLSLALYDHVAGIGTRALAGAEVLEVGCGRGGGAAFLHRTRGPSRYLGVDFSDGNVALARERHGAETLTFAVANAEALDLPDERFDVVLNVESAHCYGDRLAFLNEVHRVLRPGGELKLADVFQRRIHLPSFEDAVARSRLDRVACADVTANVIASRRQVRPLAEELTRGLGPAERTRVLNWAAVEGTRVFDDFVNGRFCYLTWVLRRPA